MIENRAIFYAKRGVKTEVYFGRLERRRIHRREEDIQTQICRGDDVSNSRGRGNEHANQMRDSRWRTIGTVGIFTASLYRKFYSTK